MGIEAWTLLSTSFLAGCRELDRAGNWVGATAFTTTAPAVKGVAGEAAAGRRHPARDEILHELAALEETEAEAEEGAAVEAEQRRHRQGVEAEEVVAEVEAQAEVQAERRCEAFAETWRGVELRWAEEEAARRKCVDEARAEPGGRRRRHAAGMRRRRKRAGARRRLMRRHIVIS
eukprot:scaffold39835_cov65-Phaeocystis_antarctica.AAC.3